MAADHHDDSTHPTTRSAISVVVPTRDRPEMLARCLESLVKSLGEQDELIVVDSASRDAAAIARVAGEAGAILLRCEIRGASVARNAGLARAANSLVAFVDDDVWVDARWADAMARCLTDHPDTAFVTGRVAPPVGQESFDVATKEDLEAAVFTRATREHMGHSASVAVRRSAIDEVGGFDAQLGAGGRFRGAEDGDLFDRLLATGREGRYEPEAMAWHDQWRGKVDLVKLHYGYGLGAGAQLAKLVRTDRFRARLMAIQYLWHWGVVDLWRTVRVRYETQIAACAFRLFGIAQGFLLGILTPVQGGHYTERLTGRSSKSLRSATRRVLGGASRPEGGPDVA